MSLLRGSWRAGMEWGNEDLPLIGASPLAAWAGPVNEFGYRVNLLKGIHFFI